MPTIMIILAHDKYYLYSYDPLKKILTSKINFNSLRSLLFRYSGANDMKDSPNFSIAQETWFSEKPISSKRSVFSMVPYNFSSLASWESKG